MCVKIMSCWLHEPISLHRYYLKSILCSGFPSLLLFQDRAQDTAFILFICQGSLGSCWLLVSVVIVAVNGSHPFPHRYHISVILSHRLSPPWFTPKAEWSFLSSLRLRVTKSVRGLVWELRPLMWESLSCLVTLLLQGGLIIYVEGCFLSRSSLAGGQTAP